LLYPEIQPPHYSSHFTLSQGWPE